MPKSYHTLQLNKEINYANYISVVDLCYQTSWHNEQFFENYIKHYDFQLIIAFWFCESFKILRKRKKIFSAKTREGCIKTAFFSHKHTCSSIFYTRGAIEALLPNILSFPFFVFYSFFRSFSHMHFNKHV